MTRPLFSVIVVAYNRKDYIMEAIQSVLIQTIEKDHYEIIVIKNIVDPMIDTFLKKHNILNINSEEKTLSGKISESAQIANGEYLCFLEDDDLWSPNRLSHFSSLLNNFCQVDYYHNGHVHFISRKQKVVLFNGSEEDKSVHLINTLSAKCSFKEFNKLTKNHSSYNLSSMIIKKDLVLSNLELFSEFGNDFVDGLIFYISVIFGSNLLIDKRKLTAVRVHSNNRSGLSIGTGSTRSFKIYNYLSDLSLSPIISENIRQLISRIDLDLKIKNLSFGLPSVLRSYFYYLKDSLRCNRMPDFDMTIKFLFRILTKKAFVILMDIYHS